jgi:peptidoglycan/xylan/chitin deacetylase (PgdA/CDA1 family)
MRLTTTRLLAIVAGPIILGLPAIYFLTGHQIIPPPPSERAGQRFAPFDQSVSGIGKPGAPDGVTAPGPTKPGTQPAAASSTNSPLREATSAIPPCDKPDGLGLSRIVQIDTTAGPEFGIQHFKGYRDFLRDKEVVLTFDDGPRPGSTEAALKALADECLRATFFEIGENASWHPQITKQVIDAGMTVGTHTWSHKDLARNPYANDPKKAEWEIEMGNSAVRSAAAGGNVAPFFRFPDLQTPPQLLSYLAERNIAIFSTDIDSRDFTMHKPEQVINSVMSQLEKRGKGIVLLHDFHRNTAEALPELLRQLKLAGYKVVHLVPKDQLGTVPKYDEMFEHRENLSSSAQPEYAAAPGLAAVAHHKGNMYMYVPAQGHSPYTKKKGGLKTGTE